MRVRCFLLATVLLIAAVGQRQGTLGAEAGIEDVRSAWAARAASVRSLAVTYREERKTYRGSANGLPVEMRGSGDFPPRDLVEIADDSRLYLDGVKVAHHSFRTDPSGAEHPVWRTAMAFNGNECRSYVDPTLYEYHEGIVHKEPVFREWGLFAIRPFLAAFRGDRPTVDHPWEDFVVSEQETSILGRWCALLRTREGVKNPREELWLDVDRGFTLVRHAQSFERRGREPVLASQLDVTEYMAKGPTGSWLPAEWSFVTFVPGTSEVSQEGRCSLVEHQLNEPIDAAEFDLPFPSGTLVDDQANGGRWFQGAGDVREPIDDNAQRAPAKNDGGLLVWWVLAGIATFLVLIVAWRMVAARRGLSRVSAPGH